MFGSPIPNRKKFFWGMIHGLMIIQDSLPTYHWAICLVDLDFSKNIQNWINHDDNQNHKVAPGAISKWGDFTPTKMDIINGVTEVINSPI